MSEMVNISDVFREIVQRVSAKVTPFLPGTENISGVYFDYGHYTDIRERLVAKSKSLETKSNRFPLIAMFEDFRIRRGDEGLTGIADMTLIILYHSNKVKTRQQREDDVFKPILIPIYNELLRQIKLSGKFMVYSESQIKHDMIKRPHWGDPAMYGNDSYLFDTVLDGIELRNLSLTTFLNNCLAS